MSGIQDFVFLDRYSIKEKDKSKIEVGDTVIVPVSTLGVNGNTLREVGKIVANLGEVLQVEVNSGTFNVPRAHIDKPTETFEQAMERVADAIASVETEGEARGYFQEAFYDIISEKRFLPGGRIISGANNGNVTMLNCFVLPSPKDQRSGIFESLADMTEIMSRSGGVGINLSTLRPKFAEVIGVNGRSSGAVSWGGIFSYATGLVEQGGSRRGALMLMLNDWHPDIFDFIKCKKEAGKVTNANISICISDAFMDAVMANSDWVLEFPDTKDKSYDEVWDGDLVKWKADGHKTIIHQTIKARELWNEITQSAWASAEPGIAFIDRYNDMHNGRYYSKIIASNPCIAGESMVLRADGENIEYFADVAQRGENLLVYTAADDGRWHVSTMRYPNKTKLMANVWKITFSNGGYVRATPDHKFYMADMTTKELKDIKPGDKVKCMSDQMEVMANEPDGQCDVFNGVVDKTHRYYVGVKSSANNDNAVLVANCGEQALPAYSVCCLGSLNLSKYAKDGGVDWELLKADTRIATRFLDNVLDVTYYPLPEIQENSLNERRIGLGTMGLADLMIQLGVKYGSQESIELTSEIYRTIAEESYTASSDIAVQKGSFPKFDADKFLKSGFMKHMPLRIRELIRKQGIRNVTLMTQAPTGTTSILGDTSSGIEPFFALEWIRNSRLGTHTERARVYDEWVEKNPGKTKPKYMVTAMEITPKQHVMVMAAAQAWVDSAISKTVNLPADASVKDVADIYFLMYNEGCKGGTVYRDASRKEQVLELVKTEKCAECGADTIKSEGCTKCTVCWWSKCDK